MHDVGLTGVAGGDKLDALDGVELGVCLPCVYTSLFTIFRNRDARGLRTVSQTSKRTYMSTHTHTHM